MCEQGDSGAAGRKRHGNRQADEHQHGKPLRDVDERCQPGRQSVLGDQVAQQGEDGPAGAEDRSLFDPAADEGHPFEDPAEDDL